MDSTDKELIECLKELEAKATPGKWKFEEYPSCSSAETCGWVVDPEIEDSLNGRDCDVELSCALRNHAIPLINRLTAQIEALQAEVERLKAEAVK